MRCAVFLPMPGARESVAMSPVAMASDRSRSGMAESMPSAVRAPTPETDSSFRKSVRSSRDAKPNSSMASSRTDRYV